MDVDDDDDVVPIDGCGADDATLVVECRLRLVGLLVSASGGDDVVGVGACLLRVVRRAGRRVGSCDCVDVVGDADDEDDVVVVAVVPASAESFLGADASAAGAIVDDNGKGGRAREAGKAPGVSTITMSMSSLSLSLDSCVRFTASVRRMSDATSDTMRSRRRIMRSMSLGSRLGCRRGAAIGAERIWRVSACDTQDAVRATQMWVAVRPYLVTASKRSDSATVVTVMAAPSSSWPGRESVTRASKDERASTDVVVVLEVAWRCLTVGAGDAVMALTMASNVG